MPFFFLPCWLGYRCDGLELGNHLRLLGSIEPLMIEELPFQSRLDFFFVTEK